MIWQLFKMRFKNKFLLKSSIFLKIISLHPRIIQYTNYVQTIYTL